MDVTMPTAAPMQRTVLSVAGLHCGSCVRHVEGGLAELSGVHATVDLASGRAEVDHPARIAVADLVAAVADAGYAAQPVA